VKLLQVFFPDKGVDFGVHILTPPCMQQNALLYMQLTHSLHKAHSKVQGILQHAESRVKM